jgi:hypothetical protein
MEQKSVNLRDFDVDRVIFGPFESGTNGLRSKLKYKYKGDVVAPLIVAVDRTVYPYGIQKAKQKVKDENGNEKFVDGKDWQVVVGPRDVHRNPEKPSEFENAPENAARLFKACDQLDEKAEEHCNAYMADLTTKLKLKKAKTCTYKASVRTSESTDADKPKPEHQHLRVKLNMDPNTERVTSNFRMVKGGAIHKLPFEKARTQSAGAEGVMFVCVASIFITAQNQATLQFRVNKIDFVKEGVDPAKRPEAVFDTTGVDYGEDVDPSKMKEQAAGEEEEAAEETPETPEDVAEGEEDEEDEDEEDLVAPKKMKKTPTKRVKVASTANMEARDAFFSEEVAAADSE